MGHNCTAVCLECGESFIVEHGHGFHFVGLRCVDCGKRKHIKLELIDSQPGKNAEELASKCRCGGKFTDDAPPRCPKCRSKNVQEDEPHILFD